MTQMLLERTLSGNQSSSRLAVRAFLAHGGTYLFGGCLFSLGNPAHRHERSTHHPLRLSESPSLARKEADRPVGRVLRSLLARTRIPLRLLTSLPSADPWPVSFFGFKFVFTFYTSETTTVTSRRLPSSLGIQT